METDKKEQAMIAKKAGYHLLAKQYTEAFNLYAEIGDNNGMENTVLHLIEEANLQLSRNGVSCAGFNPQDSLKSLVRGKQSDFVVEVCVKYLSGDANPRLLYQLAYCAPEGSKLGAAAASRLMQEFKADKKSMNRLTSTYAGAYDETKTGLFLEFCRTSDIPDGFASIKPLFLSRKIRSSYLYDYAKILNDKKLIIYALKKRYWRFWGKRPYNYFNELEKLGYAEEISALARWFEKKPKRIIRDRDINTYLDTKKYLQEYYDADALARLCLTTIKKNDYALNHVKMNCSLTPICLIEIARAYESAGKYLSALEIYMKLGNNRLAEVESIIQRICFAEGKKSKREKEHLLCTLDVATIKRLSKSIFSALWYMALRISPVYCARWESNGLRIDNENYAELAQALMDKGYLYESILQKAGITVTVEHYLEALANLTCEPQLAEEYLKKIDELTSSPDVALD